VPVRLTFSAEAQWPAHAAKADLFDAFITALKGKRCLSLITCVVCEVPVGLGAVGITVVLPGGDFLDEGCLSGIRRRAWDDRRRRVRRARSSKLHAWSVVPCRQALAQPPASRAGKASKVKPDVDVEMSWTEQWSWRSKNGHRPGSARGA